MKHSSLFDEQMELFCTYCGGEGEVLCPAQWSDEPRMMRCPVCNGTGMPRHRLTFHDGGGKDRWSKSPCPNP